MALKVLIADDNKLLLEMSKDALLNEGFEVIAVDNGVEVYKKVLSEKPDIVLLDIMMPGIDGIEICGNLKRSPVTKNLIIVIHSGKTDVQLMDMCYELGAEAYIIKTSEYEAMAKKLKDIARDKLGRTE